jgi:hypothetical protein
MTIFYEFSTVATDGFGFTGAGAKGNIGFGVNCISQSETLHMLIPNKVYASHVQKIRGWRRLPSMQSTSRLQCVFDNTHSLMRGKVLNYHLVVALNENIIRAAGEDSAHKSGVDPGSVISVTSSATVAEGVGGVDGEVSRHQAAPAAPAAHPHIVEPEPEAGHVPALRQAADDGDGWM